MKTIRLKHSVLATCAALSLAAPASLTFAQTADLTVSTFDDDINGCGVEWGTGTVAWDETQDNTGNGGGSCLVTVDFSNSSDTPAADYFCIGGGNPWYFPTTIDASQYKSLDFDILYDNTSDIDFPHFNDLSTWDTTLTNKDGSKVMQSWAGSGYLSGSLSGIDIEFCGTYNQMAPPLATTNIPAAAASGWTHVSIPINPAEANIGAINGIVFHKWINQQWGIASNAQARFWIDNVVFKGNALPPTRPTMSAPPTRAIPGLNVFASTDNHLYDRQSAVLRQTNGLSWVGQATPSHPVSYSFTIVGFPNSTNTEAWMFLCPNPAYMDNAPDWNETNCAIVFLQANAAGATGHFRYKVGESMGQDMYTGAGIYTAAPGTGGGTLPESGDLATVNSTTGVYGTWTLKFTSDTAGQLTAPDGSATSFTFPSYNAPKFAESHPVGETNHVGFYIYLGTQANQLDGLNQAVVYSDFAVSNTAAPFSENFLTDTVLDTTNTWTTAAATGPQGVLIVPSGSAYWLQWTLPDSGFSLQTSPALSGDSLAWTSPTIGPVIGMAGVRQQLVSTSELPAGNAAFFRVIKRTFTKLQILLPGETAAPNTPTGKTGTPIEQSAVNAFDVIVNAVDDNWNVVSSATDTIDLTSSDWSFMVVNFPWSLNLSGGTATFQVMFFDDGSATITATDDTDGTKTPATSATVNY